jgi:hypothetical protein
MPNTGNATPLTARDAVHRAAELWQGDPEGFIEACADAIATARAPRLFDVPTVADLLCDELADAVGQFRNGTHGGRPAVTKRWREDMRLLLERGPKGEAEACPLSADKVRGCIAYVFTELAEPEGSSTFCWAAQVQSPAALRRHWWRIRAAAIAHRDRTRGGKGAALTRHVERMTGVQAPSLAETMAATQEGRLAELMARQPAALEVGA